MIKDVSIFLVNYQDYNLPLFSLTNDQKIYNELSYRKFDNVSINFLDFSPRATHVLIALNIRSISELLFTTPNRIYLSNMCGIKTFKEIIKKTYNFLKACDDKVENSNINIVPSSIEMENIYSKEANQISLMFFPLFGYELAEIDMSRVHSSYKTNTLLSKLDFNIRTKKVIRHLDITTLGELLNYSPDKLVGNENFGAGSLFKLRNVVSKYILDSSIDFTKKNDVMLHAVNPDSLDYFPLFGSDNGKVILDNIHSSYKADDLLTQIDFSVRANNIFKEIRINTIGELLNTDSEFLMQLDNFGKSTLTEVKTKINSYLLGGTNNLLKDNYNSLSDLLCDYCRLMLNLNQKKVIDYSYGLSENIVLNKTEIGDKLGLTRERARQIYKKAKEKILVPSYAIHLEIYKKAIKKIICRAGGIISFQKIIPLFDDKFNFDKTDIIHFKLFLNILQIEEDSVNAVLPDYPCLYCKKLYQIILDKMSKNEQTQAADLLKELKDQCTISECEVEYKVDMNFSLSFLRRYIKRRKDLKDKFKCKEGYIYDKLLYNIKYGKLAESIESILKHNGYPMHFNEVFKEYKDFRPDSKTPIGSITAQLQKNEYIILWDRGTYIHKEKVRINKDFLVRINKWIESNILDSEFYAIYKVYNNFKDECKKNGISSYSALYSLLKLSTPNIYYFRRFPFITKNDQAFYIYSFIGELIIDNGGEIESQDYYDVLMSKGYEKDRAKLLISSSSSFVHTEYNTIIHVNDFHVNREMFVREILEYTLTEIEKNDYISANKIFDRKIVTCKSMGISNTKTLLNCYRIFASDQITLRNGGILSKEETGKIILEELLLDYLKENTLVGVQKIKEYFVEKLGYSELSLESKLFYSNDIITVSKDIYTHFENINLTSAKLNNLYELFENVYNKSGDIPPNLEYVFNYCYNDLPEINNQYTWSLTLLKNIFNKRLQDKLNIIGNTGLSFTLKNDDISITTLEDLICLLIKKQKKSYIQLDELEKILYKNKIIISKLTRTMVEKFSRVEVSGKYVLLKEIDYA